MQGVVLCQTQIVIITGASLNPGVALARTQVTLQANTLVSPGNLSAVDDNRARPQKFALEQNYPNPFNPNTSITYELPRASDTKLSVFDLLGREVSVLVNERREAGVHEVKFDGSNLTNGVYFYRIQTGEFTPTKRLLLLK